MSEHNRWPAECEGRAMERHSRVAGLNRPLGVSMETAGGLKG